MGSFKEKEWIGHTGQAYVTIAGKMFFLGVYGSLESKAEYDRIIREWLSNGRAPTAVQMTSTITIVELIDRFLTHAETYYLKDGKPTGSKFSDRFQFVRPQIGHGVHAFVTQGRQEHADRGRALPGHDQHANPVR